MRVTPSPPSNSSEAGTVLHRCTVPSARAQPQAVMLHPILVGVRSLASMLSLCEIQHVRYITSGCRVRWPKRSQCYLCNITMLVESDSKSSRLSDLWDEFQDEYSRIKRSHPEFEDVAVGCSILVVLLLIGLGMSKLVHWSALEQPFTEPSKPESVEDYIARLVAYQNVTQSIPYVPSTS